MTRSLALAVTAFAAAALLGGCGGEKLYHVSGTITCDGKPIPKGSIHFDPDPTKGTTGSGGVASIEDGKFDTSIPGKGTGIRGGAYHIRILGYDGKEAPEAPFGKYLFPEHRLTKELPAQDQTFNYNVKTTR